MAREIGSPLRENQGLRAEYLRWRNRYNVAFAELQRREERLSVVRTNALANSEVDSTRALELEENNMLLGLTDVRGNGITIIIDDNREMDTREAVNLNALLIHEDDILNIINELFNAGADAVSVGDERTEQRIVATTAIMCDGNIIRINNEVIGVPVIIRAIGSTSALHHALTRPGGYLDILENDGIQVLVHREDNITIPRFEGIHRYEYIRR